MNVSEMIQALDQKEEQLVAELNKVRTAKEAIVSLNLDSDRGAVKKVTVTNNPPRAGININLPAAKSRVLPHIKSKGGITFKSLLKKCTQVNGTNYTKNSMRAYLSALSVDGKIEKRKDRFFRVS